MDRFKFEDEMKALDVCAKCMDEAKPRLSLLRCTGCRMVLYCTKAHQTAHWTDHKSFCKARKQAAAAPALAQTNGSGSAVPPLPSSRCAGPDTDECETYVSICDATGVFSLLGMFWKSGKGSLCNLAVRLGQGPIACLQSPLQDWEPRTRLAALKTLTVQGSADYVRVSTGVAAYLAQRTLDEGKDAGGQGPGEMSSECKVGIARFLVASKAAKDRGGVDNGGLEDYLASDAHVSFKEALMECCDSGGSLDVFFFGLLNERREFRDCYSFLEEMSSLSGAETHEEALRKLGEQGKGKARRYTARLCAHACLCFHLAGLPGVASAMQIAKEGCEQDFESSPFVRAMMYRTVCHNSKGEVVPSPRPELSEQYKETVMQPLVNAQEATGQLLVQLTPVSLEIKTLLEQGILL